MKTTTLICTCLVALLLSCSREIATNVVPNEKLALVSPKGFRIATDLNELETKISLNAKKAFGDKSYEVTRIDYTETSRQSAALIEFKSADNELGTVLYVGVPETQMANGRMLKVPPTKVDCSGGCDAVGATCRERVIIGSDDSVSYECTCQGSCAMTVTRE